ncbi:hypothetical protein PHYSODRAFT_336810 [Phytophthora sojae]|uniref:Uncharacterized protein n=1 Tax=Phytophthora sojae (strain P6497) TaxID=1094619 RepID=G4ZWF7_PHYSP|nr:hypothetical protein PHYSODRAFT_336810 [Phytophthora sojae]EGZ12385.1 hypothetical protein PHYSODRAFT_336810 [Phytophthora sojae]|eukprot:XP_009532718.1 hypothetical protein PHYSODRAFT_336810 [Phytophthora sojae]
MAWPLAISTAELLSYRRIQTKTLSIASNRPPTRCHLTHPAGNVASPPSTADNPTDKLMLPAKAAPPDPDAEPDEGHTPPVAAPVVLSSRTSTISQSHVVRAASAGHSHRSVST